MKNIRCCKTCLHARWPLTPTGRIFRNTAGECRVPLPVVVLPDCVTKAYGYHEWRRQRLNQDMGKECPLWERNFGDPMNVEAT